MTQIHQKSVFKESRAASVLIASNTPNSDSVRLLDRYPGDNHNIIFAARALNPTDGHWYANFGYYSHDPSRKAFAQGAKLYQLNLKSRILTTLLADPKGGVRDPSVSYDGRKILLSYRPGGTQHYHLYELDLSSPLSPPSGPSQFALRQLTSGPFDDFEAAYLPDGGIVFVSSRCNRWVNCWLTQVAVLHRCDADGSNLRPLSSNNEHDNTPWPLPDGRILYTRWEYVDRSQVHFHHLWAANPDGTGQMTWFGNLHPGITMIDAKPIPGSDKIIASFSPGHGQREHDGAITIIDPKGGPDATNLARSINKITRFRDPWAFSEDLFLAASHDTIALMDASGRVEEIFKLPPEDRAAKLECHEPRPLNSRPREPIIQPRFKPDRTTGRFVLANVNDGRNMSGVQPGEIKKLLVLETLPMPVHYTGGMEPISYGGTFTLERILGTVPVEADGSAYFEVPALRSVFFVALDENDLAVKRMQSFTSVQPGEVLSCVGCHEHRAQTPRNDSLSSLALRKPAAPIQPIPAVPEIFDFPRDVQPVLNALCTDCHGYEPPPRGGPRAGRLLLTGDRGPLYSHSYYMLTVARLFADGRNQPRSNYEPRALGSSASRLLTLLADERGVSFWQPAMDDPRLITSRHIVFNLSRPELSLILLAPLSPEAGGWGLCQPAPPVAQGPSNSSSNSNSRSSVFASTSDPDYQAILAMITAGKQFLERDSTRFDMPHFRPRPDWVREMKRYGVIPQTAKSEDITDVYAIEQDYWKSLWYQPPSSATAQNQ